MPVTPQEVERLYRRHERRLRRLVRFDVRAGEATIEDACQVAWSRLLDQSERVHGEAAFSWVIRTATREAARLLGREKEAVSLEGLLERGGEGVLSQAAACSPEEMVELRERLTRLSELPVRQQRLLWLQGLGLSYVEMAEHESCTRRTAERQLMRAKRATRSELAA